MGTFIGEVVGFLIVIFVLWRYVVPRVRQMMKKEQETVRKQVEDSEAASERLEEAEAKYHDAIEEARTEAAEIIEGARADVQRIVQEMREQADREVERIRRRGAEQLENERKQVIRELHAHVADLSTSLAGKLVSEHLSDGERRGATVDRFLDELEGMSASNGEQGVSMAKTPVVSEGEA
ncbi:MAG: F0F1 ATP synthase subunit B [Sciscionella sp.]